MPLLRSCSDSGQAETLLEHISTDSREGFERARYRGARAEQRRCCLERGVKVRLTLAAPLDPDDLPGRERGITERYVARAKSGGFYRFTVGGCVAASGALGSCDLTLLFALVRRDRALDAIEALFPGFKEDFEWQRGVI